jgi:hypothetical protein
MKVKDLIKKLSACDPNAIVFVAREGEYRLLDAANLFEDKEDIVLSGSLLANDEREHVRDEFPDRVVSSRADSGDDEGEDDELEVKGPVVLINTWD